MAKASSERKRVVVVGGGLAGLTAALDLAAAGVSVTLLEARPTLGGAVQTLPEREGDPQPPPDNGQHVALGCCAAYVAFVERIGQSESLRRLRLSLPVIDEHGRVARLGAGVGLLRYGHLTPRERVAVAVTALRIGRLDAATHEGETFGRLLRRYGTSERVIDRFWDVFVRPALNLRTDEASAALGIFTVKTALLGPRSGSDLLLPVAPLGAMHGDAAAAELARLGADVRTSARVEVLEESAVLLSGGERVPADAVVLATRPDEAAVLLGEEPPPLEDSPIVSVHLWFDRRILELPLAALLASDAHWVFDRGALTGHAPPHGQYLTVVSSGVPELMEERGRGVVELIAGQLTERLGRAELLWSRVSREPRATFAGRPGTAAMRPPAETALSHVVRAGAWTSSPWPATMEAAVQSGSRASALVLERLVDRAAARATVADAASLGAAGAGGRA